MSENQSKILVVDDERAVRLALKKCLSREGYLVEECEDPREAVGIIEKEGIELVICDYQMPGMLGIDVLRKVKLVKPSVIRIMLTGNADLDMAIRAINEGEIYRFLVKPWDNNELVRVVRLALEERTGAPEPDVAETARRDLERSHPGISSVERDERGAVVISSDEPSE